MTTNKGRLQNVVSAVPTAQQGGVFTATSPEEIAALFAGFGEMISQTLGGSNVSVDDGVPSLASVASYNADGVVGAFTYYITDPNSNESVWTAAPGATYSSENGVTWDLSKVGTLKEGWTYSIEFQVWPSQEAYDLVADLNNGLVAYDDLTDEQKAQIVEDNGVYTIKTNTHLNTNYSFNGTQYVVTPESFPSETMELDDETIKVTKRWENGIDDRTPSNQTDITLTVQKDGEDYLEATPDRKSVV